VPGQPGQSIQNIISVGMLSEGWDAKTVTHVMGLRAFSSQLLCEQVVGRGLRRTFRASGGRRPAFVTNDQSSIGTAESWGSTGGGLVLRRRGPVSRRRIFP
jgi:superfamily II DNA or RNA helicase